MPDRADSRVLLGGCCVSLRTSATTFCCEVDGSHVTNTSPTAHTPKSATGSTLAAPHRQDATMSRLKAETLSIRTSVEIKHLLRLAAAHERRSVASIVEILVLKYAQQYDLHTAPHPSMPPPQRPLHHEALPTDTRIL
ncbi:hypothetical protein LPH43_07125 [Xylella taiwanensis]|nr:hypothetical protein [Xylella taiwanensis]UFN01505.1 hypothetical protein LPH43_07125 [Xylella taiwanensis]